MESLVVTAIMGRKKCKCLLRMILTGVDKDNQIVVVRQMRK